MKTSTKTLRTVLFTGLFAVLATAALALDLQTARTGGMIGEQLDGYTAAISKDAEVAALVADVNARRKAEYQRISGENGQPVATVAKLAAVQIIEKLPAGAAYQSEAGNWVKK